MPIADVVWGVGDSFSMHQRTNVIVISSTVLDGIVEKFDWNGLRTSVTVGRYEDSLAETIATRQNFTSPPPILVSPPAATATQLSVPTPQLLRTDSSLPYYNSSRAVVPQR